MVKNKKSEDDIKEVENGSDFGDEGLLSYRRKRVIRESLGEVRVRVRVRVVWISFFWGY